MSVKKMLMMIKQVKREQGKSGFKIFFDMLFCALKYNVGYQDYRVFGFAGLGNNERKTYLTMNKNLALVRLMNSTDGRSVFNDKRQFFRKYDNYIGRSYIDIADKGSTELKSFCLGKESVFVKAPCSFGGQGIGEINISEEMSYEALYGELVKNGQTLVEEKINQHEKMSVLHPYSINTLRIATLKVKDEVHILCRIIRIGRDKSVIDNITSGGLYAPVDENGVISHPAFCDKTGEAFTVHPTSRVFIIGYKIPYFDEAVELVKEIAEKENDVCYAGWDVAITPTGPIIVEGNEIPSYEIMQNYLHESSGMLPLVEKILGRKL